MHNGLLLMNPAKQMSRNKFRKNSPPTQYRPSVDHHHHHHHHPPHQISKYHRLILYFDKILCYHYSEAPQNKDHVPAELSAIPYSSPGVVS